MASLIVQKEQATPTYILPKGYKIIKHCGEESDIFFIRDLSDNLIFSIDKMTCEISHETTFSLWSGHNRYDSDFGALVFADLKKEKKLNYDTLNNALYASFLALQKFSQLQVHNLKNIKKLYINGAGEHKSLL